MEEECKRCKLCPQPRLDRRCLFFNLCRGWNLTSLGFLLLLWDRPKIILSSSWRRSQESILLLDGERQKMREECPSSQGCIKRRLRRLQSKERRNRIREPSIIFQSWLSGHPQKKMKRDTDKRMTYQDCIPRPLTSSRIPVQWLETWELVFSSTALG